MYTSKTCTHVCCAQEGVAIDSTDEWPEVECAHLRSMPIPRQHKASTATLEMLPDLFKTYFELGASSRTSLEAVAENDELRVRHAQNG